MGLINGSLQIGTSAVLANQSAMQVIGNNIANAGDPNYTRQSAVMSPVAGSVIPEGFDPGAGVQLSEVIRNYNAAIEEQLRSAMSDQSYDDKYTQYLSRLESFYNELTDSDISSSLNDFFTAFSNLSTNPQDATARNNVLQEAETLIGQIGALQNQVLSLYGELGDSMESAIDEINTLSTEIANLNVQIANSTSAGQTASALIDERDTMLKELATLADVKVFEQPDGQVNVYLGSDPLVQDNQARQLKLVEVPEGNVAVPRVYYVDTGKELHFEGGTCGAIDDLIHEVISDSLSDIDTLTSSLIYEVNKVHSSGQGLEGYTEISANHVVSDPDLPLDEAGLFYTPENGSFMISVKDASTGEINDTVQINIDLNDIGTETTLTDLANQINAIDNVTAVISTSGKLSISTDNDNYSITFNDDTSNVLACLGINTFFTGTDAASIKVNSDLTENPNLLACSASDDPDPGDGSNAESLFGIMDASIDSLQTMSIIDYYQSMVSELATKTAYSQQQYEIHSAVAETLQSQRDSISGVSIDEETIDLISVQTAFQGACKYLNVINELLDEIMNTF